MAANEDELGSLHSLTTKVLMLKLAGTPILDEDGKPTGEIIPPSAADIQAATKFLKDNNITCAPSENNEIGALEASLKERQRRRNSRLTPQELADAKEAAGFSLTGLN